MTVYVVQDQTELRERVAAQLVELLGPDVFAFETPWELETFLNENPPQSSDVVVADLVSPDYWNSSPKEPLRRRSRPHSTEPEQAQLALIDAAIDRIENYLKPIRDRHRLRFVIFSRLAELVRDREDDAALLTEALSAIGVATEKVVDRSRIYGGGPGDEVEVAREVARLIDPVTAARLGELYVVEDHLPTANRIVKELSGLERSFSAVKVVAEIWHVPGTGTALVHPDDVVPAVVVSDLFPIRYWDPLANPKPPLGAKRFKKDQRLSYEAIIAAAEDVGPNYLKELTDRGTRVIVYTHVIPFARAESEDDATRVVSRLISSGVSRGDIIEKQLQSHALEGEMQSIRDRVGAAIRDLANAATTGRA